MRKDFKAGAMLIISNGNPIHLMTITGSSFWLSNHFMIQCDIELFNHHVRSANDPIF